MISGIKMSINFFKYGVLILKLSKIRENSFHDISVKEPSIELGILNIFTY